MTLVAGDGIAGRAMTQLGTPFRLHGRTPGVALDCVGLAAYAVNLKHIPSDYSLKGVKLTNILSYMDSIGLHSLRDATDIRSGDVAIVTCAPRQFHLMIRAADGWVHGHAGLRKVVHTPGASPWLIVAVRRMNGV